MKTTAITLLLLATFALSAQENQKETTIRIKKVENINGVEKIIDTTYTVKGKVKINGADPKQLEGSSGQLDPLIVIVDEEDEVAVHSNPASSEKAAPALGKNRIVIITNEINGGRLDTLPATAQNDIDIQRALAHVKAEDGTIRVEQIYEVNTQEDKNSNRSQSKKIVIIKTIKITDASLDETKSLSKTAGIENLNLQLDKIAVKPNPTNGLFNLKFTLDQQNDTQVSVYDINGKSIYEESLANFKGTYNRDIDLSSNIKGIYYVKVTQGKNSSVKKLVID